MYQRCNWIILILKKKKLFCRKKHLLKFYYTFITHLLELSHTHKKKKQNSKMFLKYLYYCFKIFGLATLKVDTKYLLFTHSKTSMVYNMFLVTLIITMNVFSVKSIYSDEAKWMLIFDKFIHIIQVFSFLISTVIILILYCARQKEMMKIATNFITILESLCTFWKKKNDYVSLLSTVKAVYCLDSIICMMMIGTSFKPGISTEFTLGVNLTGFFVHCVSIQYSTVLIMIFYTIKMINSKFKSIFEKPTLTNDISFLLDNKLENKALKVTMDQFLHLRSLYLSLYSVIKDLSSFFAVPMLLCIYSIFVTLTIYMYYSAKTIFCLVGNIPIMAYIHSWMWILLYVFTLIVLTKSASAIVIEVKKKLYFFLIVNYIL